MEYFKWKLTILLLFGIIATGFGKSTVPPPSLSSNNDEYDNDGSFQADEEDYDEGDEDFRVPIENDLQNNDVSAMKKYPPVYFSESSLTKNVYEGENVILNCDAKNLHNNSLILWYNGSQLIVTHLQVINNRVSIKNLTAIEIHNIDYHDRNQYICSVLPDNVNLTISLNVIQTPQPLVIYYNGNDVTDSSIRITQGNRFEIECQSLGGKNAKIKWSLNGERASNHIKNITDGKIIIESIDSHQSGVYQCFGDDDSQHLPIRSVTVNVQYKPEISTHRHYVNTMQNDRAELYCDYKSEPIAIIEWRKTLYNHFETLPTISNKYTIKNTVHKGRNRTYLLISDVDENDLGEYQCFAKNSIGSKSTNIHLIYEPETPQYETHEINGKVVKVHWLVKSKQPLVEAAVDYKLNGTHNKWMTSVLSGHHRLNDSSGTWKLTHELDLSPGKWHVKMKVKNTFGWSRFSNENVFVILEETVEDIPPEEVHLGNIGRKTTNSNSVNKLCINTWILIPFLILSMNSILKF